MLGLAMLAFFTSMLLTIATRIESRLVQLELQHNQTTCWSA
jgi:hypothetical protein